MIPLMHINCLAVSGFAVNDLLQRGEPNVMLEA